MALPDTAFFKPLLLILAFGCLAAPPAPAQERTTSTAPMIILAPPAAGDNAATSEAAIGRQIDLFTQRFLRAWNGSRWEGLLPLYASNALMLPPNQKVVEGREEILRQYRASHQSGVMIQMLQHAPTHAWECGTLAVTCGKAMMSYTMPGGPNLITEYSIVVDVWNRKPDGSVELVVDAWVNDRTGGAANRDTTESAAIHYEQLNAGTEKPEELQAVFEQVRDLDLAFHRVYLEDPLKAAEHYAEEAILIGADALITQGRERIVKDLKAQERPIKFLDLGQEVLGVGGNAGLVFVVNKFTWKFLARGSATPQTLPGKGVHIWKRVGDGWVLILDLFNMDNK